MQHNNPDGLPDYVGMDMEVPDIKLVGNVDELIASFSVGEHDFSSLSAITGEQFALKMFDEAVTYIGVSRATDIHQVGKFLGIFDLPTKMDGKWVPFCASGLSYASAKGMCVLSGIPFTPDNSVQVFKGVLKSISQQFFLPSPSCYYVKEDAVKRGTWMPVHSTKRSDVKKGYLVLYNFEGATTPHHIGIVESAQDNLHTVEFNTSSADNANGGAVSRRVRSYNCVLGYVKLY